MRSTSTFLGLVLLFTACGGEAGEVGPTGPEGPPGAAGPTGPAGPAGPAGPTGPAGVAGPAGPSGPMGPAGAMGATGPAGAMGATGPAGPSGPMGPVGLTGPAGATGSVGPAGPAGQGVTVTAESPGTNCPGGGQRIVSASGTAYVCNGLAPQVVHLGGADLPVGGFAAGTELTVDFVSTPFTNDLAGADLAGNRFVVPTTGLYQVSGRGYFCPQTSHYTALKILSNGNTIAFDTSPIASGCRNNLASETLYLTAGEVLTMTVFDSANGPTSGISALSMTVVRLR